MTSTAELKPPTPALVAELRALLALSVPACVAQLGLMALNVTDNIMVGWIGGGGDAGVEAIGQVSLGNVWIIAVRIFGMGILMGIDPIVSQAHGAGDSARLGLTLQRGLAVALVLSLPLSLLGFATGPVLELLGQDPGQAAAAHEYVIAQLPGLPASLLWIVLRHYLGGRGVQAPIVWTILAGVGINVVLDWVLIHGHFGFPALGVRGAGIATALAQWFLLGALVFLTLKLRLHRGGWEGWRREALSPRGWRELFAIGLPVGFQFSFEYWAFHIATLWAGMLGKSDLAAHSVVLNMISFAFMVPVGISIGAAIRVGHRIGAGDGAGARYACKVAFGLGAGAMLVFSAIFYGLRWELPLAYNKEPAVVALSASLLPIAALFQLFDGTQCIGGGLLRGMGRTKTSALIHLVGFYGLSLPLAAWLTFRAGQGLRGIWWGLALGVTSTAVLFVFWVRALAPRGRAAPVESVVCAEPAAPGGESAGSAVP